MKVIAGRHEGETGLVVRIETNLAVLLSDLTLQEVLNHVCVTTITRHFVVIFTRMRRNIYDSFHLSLSLCSVEGSSSRHPAVPRDQ